MHLVVQAAGEEGLAQVGQRLALHAHLRRQYVVAHLSVGGSLRPLEDSILHSDMSAPLAQLCAPAVTIMLNARQLRLACTWWMNG